MVTKEIRQFVITQMKEANWEVENFNNLNKYTSKHLTINHYTTINQGVDFLIKIPSGTYSSTDLKINRKELGINLLHFRWLLILVKRSVKLSDKRKREAELSRNWKKFLEKNKDIKRDNKINQIID